LLPYHTVSNHPVIVTDAVPVALVAMAMAVLTGKITEPSIDIANALLAGVHTFISVNPVGLPVTAALP
jgi:hypothetical protein